MSIVDELTDSNSADEPLTHFHKEERVTPCLELESRCNPELKKHSKTWLQIADKFRQCLVTSNLQCAGIVEFLGPLLTHCRRKGPTERTRKFTKSICNYLFAVKYLASKVPLNNSYYDLLRKILVLYCILELRVVNCFVDDEKLASDILLKITLIMQGSNTISVLDVLIDIDEEISSIRSSIRSSTVMNIVHRKYLSRDVVGGPIELDDNNFVKHLILFYLWYKAESLTEKPNVLKIFLSRIKPSRKLRSNPFFAPHLNSYNHDDTDDYKKLIQQPFKQKALVMALRESEINTEWQHDFQENIFVDLTAEKEVIVKTEIDLTLNLPNEVINLDDDDDDIYEIKYLPTLYKRLADINHGESRLILRKKVPMEIVEINGSGSECDSDVESTAFPKLNSSMSNTADLQAASYMESYSSDLFPSTAISDDDRPSVIFPNLKTYSRTDRGEKLSRENRLTSSEQMEMRRKTLSLSLPTYNVKSCPFKHRSRSLTTNKGKKVISLDSPAKHVFIRCDYQEPTNENNTQTPSISSVEENPSNADMSSKYIVTGPQCNFPYLYTSSPRSTSPTSSQTEENKDGPTIQRRKSKKRKGPNIIASKKARTSMNRWMQRKNIYNETKNAIPNFNERGRKRVNSTYVPQNVNNQSISITKGLALCNEFSICLKRCDVTRTMKRVSVDVIKLNDEGLKKLAQSSEDMTLKEIMDAKDQMQNEKLQKNNALEESLLVELCRPLVMPEIPMITLPSLNGVSSTESVKRNKETSEKSSTVKSQFNFSMSKSVIKSKQKRSVDYLKRQMKRCSISLKKISDNVVHPPSSQRTLVNEPITNSINQKWESICRLPIKSPQEYQFKRSFEKIPLNESTWILQTKEMDTPAALPVEKMLISSQPISRHQLPQSSMTVFDTTSQTPQLEIQSEFSSVLAIELNNQSSNGALEVEASLQLTASLPDQTTIEQNLKSAYNVTAGEIDDGEKFDRKVTNYSPDTTTSATPQYSSISDTDSRCNVVTVETNSIQLNYLQAGKQFRMLFDDCDNDIPSPVYSPYAGRRKSSGKQKSSISKLRKMFHQPVLNEYKTVSDLITPIDLRVSNEISVVSVDNDRTITNEFDNSVDSTQITNQKILTLDTGQSIGHSLSPKLSTSSAIATNITARYSESNTTDDLESTVSTSKTVNVDNLKPKIYVKSNKQLYPAA